MRTALLLLIGVCAHGQNVQTPTASIEGRVVSSVSGTPLSEVRVTAYQTVISQAKTGASQHGFNGQTGADGRYRIEAIPPGTYRIAAESEGYAAFSDDALVTLGPGDAKTFIDIKLVALGAVTGLILDSDNQPMAGAEVVALVPVYINGIRQYAERATTKTAANGRYRIQGLAAGQYIVSARFDTASKADANGERYVPTYFPGGKDLRSAVALEVRDGVSAEGINIKPEKARLATLKGKMVNRTGVAGNPVIATLLPRAAVTIGPRRTYRLAEKSPDFVFPDVPPGDYLLNVEVHSDNLRATNGRFGFQGRQLLTVGPDSLDNIVVTVDRGIDIPGELVVEDGTIPDLTVLEVRLPVADLEARTVGYPPKGPVDADGHFTVRAAALEHHVANVVGVPRGFYIKSFTSGAQDLLTSELDLTPGIASPLRIVLSGKAGRVTGTVTDRDEHPLGKATLALVPGDQAALKNQVRYFRTAVSGPDGQFTIADVTPGEYTIYAFDKAEDGAWLDPSFRAPFEARATKVTLREGAAEVVNLKVIQTR